MNKDIRLERIPDVFERDVVTKRAIPLLNKGSEWTLAGTGHISVMLDGINVQVVQNEDKSFSIMRLVEVNGERKYVPCFRNEPTDAPLWKAFDVTVQHNLAFLKPAVYVAIGPDINGNPHQLDLPRLCCINPMAGELIMTPGAAGVKTGYGVKVRDMYDSIRAELERSDCPGIVFVDEDQHLNPRRYAKVTRKDFGFSWPIQTQH